MKANTYFKKYGKIYGVSYKYEFNQWTGYIKEFDSYEEAEAWLNEEESDFMTRELGSLRYCKSIISNN